MKLLSPYVRSNILALFAFAVAVGVAIPSTAQTHYSMPMGGGALTGL